MLFITDNIDSYRKANFNKKILFEKSIVQTTAFSKEAANAVNQLLNGIENVCCELAVNELAEKCKNLPEMNVNRYVDTRPGFDRWYSQLYPYFHHYGSRKHLIVQLVEYCKKHLGEPLKGLTLDLDEEYSLLTGSDFGELQDVTIRIRRKRKHFASAKLFRQLYYRAVNLAKKKHRSDTGGKRHYAFYVYDTANQLGLYESVFETLKSAGEIHTTVVLLDSGDEKTFDHLIQPAKNFEVVRLRDFKPLKLVDCSRGVRYFVQQHREYNVFLESGLSQSIAIQYGFIEHSMEKLQPDAVFCNTTVEMSRLVSDVARAKNIPSVNVDYALFSDDFVYMHGRMQFDARFCLGEDAIRIWKKHEDQSRAYFPIGLLKSDKTPELLSRKDFLLKNGLSAERTTILFASTSSAPGTVYGIEKQQICQDLIDFCECNNYQLLIKKHPSEFDRSLDSIVARTEFPYVRIFEHQSGLLEQLLASSDLVVSQNSSIALEAACYQVPTAYVVYGNNRQGKELITMKNEECVHIIASIDAVSDILQASPAPDCYQKVIERYMTAFDGRSYERFFEATNQVLSM